MFWSKNATSDTEATSILSVFILSDHCEQRNSNQHPMTGKRLPLPPVIISAAVLTWQVVLELLQLAKL
jgi:hypothetical protein